MSFWKAFFWVLGTLLVSLFIAVMLMVAYPNVLKLGAPLLCPDDRPDPFVVRYDVQTTDGTGTNFTLFCMSERGEIHEVGTWEPLLVLYGFVTALVVAFLLVRLALRLLRGIGGGPGPPGDPTDPPAAPDPFLAITDQQGPVSS